MVREPTTILAMPPHAQRIISHLITRRLRQPVSFFWWEGECHIDVPGHIDLESIRKKLKGIEFRLET